MLREPKDLGVIQMGESYGGQYVPNGYLTDWNGANGHGAGYGLTVQTYEATLEPGHWGYFEASNVVDSCLGTPVMVAKRGEATASGDKPEEYVSAGAVGVPGVLYYSADSHQSLADWLLAKDTRWNYDNHKNGDQFLLEYIDSVGGSTCAGSIPAHNYWYQGNLENEGSKPSKVTFSLVSPFADSMPAKNKLNVTYLDSPVKLDSDVVPTTPHAGDIAWLKSKGISKGYGDGTFGGMRTVVRQDMAAFLYRLAGSPAFDESTAGHPFRDVDASTPHHKEILWAYSQGLVKGFEDGTFGGGRTVVRQDMAAFLARYARKFPSKEPAGAAKSFTDVNPSTPHADDIAWLSRTGVTAGYDNGDGSVSFGGMRDVVRQDMAAFLHRMSANVLK